MKILRPIYSLLTALGILVGCTQGADLLPKHTTYPILWSVNLEQGQDTRALVDAGLLQSMCTQTGDGTNESMGVWGQHTFKDRTIQDFMDTPLNYGSNAWTYSGDTRYWTLETVYNFRAYYPQKLMAELMTEKSATCFRGRINTQEVQKDILVTALQIDTRTANLNNAVPLNMQHVFAAIKFKVKAIDGFTPSIGDGITSCWLQNATDASDLFSPSGTLDHIGNEIPEINWSKDLSTIAPMYKWEHESLNFDTETMFYASNGNGVGNVYTQNDGWLLVIPQEVKSETLSFCYTRKNTGDKVFSVKIPAITYERGKRYNYLLEINGASAELSLSIQPWNMKDFSYKISVTNMVFVRKGTSTIENETNIKHDSLYLIKNNQSGKYFYANPETKRVEARDLNIPNGAIHPNYIWKLQKTSPLGGSTWRYYYVESMGIPEYYIQGTQVNSAYVPLAPNPTSSDQITIRLQSGALRFRASPTNDSPRFLAVNGEILYGDANAYTYAPYAVSLHEITRQRADLQIE